ncbi:MAG: FtsW/RodA/SpoVE family cell cycle protein [Acidobacteriota bacterium]|nr:FtsW/RodA/SpoVE family cell cycle protein [Acidobacteriota bacterium]
MTTTRATAAGRIQQIRLRESAGSRNLETALLLGATIVAALGLYLIYAAKAAAFVAAGDKQTVNLNRIKGPYDLIPLLQGIPPADQDFTAREIFEAVRHGQHFDNDGAIARMRVHEEDLRRVRGLDQIPKRLAQARQRREQRADEEEENRGWFGKIWNRIHPPAEARPLSIPLLTGLQFAQLKPHLVVRTPDEFRRRFLLWSILALVAFWAVHFFWRLRVFPGDNVLLPSMFTLCALGLMLMLSLRDPLRDTLSFADFAGGVLAGCALLALFSQLDYERMFSRLSFVPLLAAVLLAIALGLFGSGPGTSDAKVNLFFFQPVELIRILLVLFLAGYFARNWDALRELRQHTGPLARFGAPRLEYLFPVAAGVLVSLALFFWLSDLGPALVVGCLFLTLYAVARGRFALALGGFAVIVLGFAVGHLIGYPHHVTQRIDMWLSPWDNHVLGGDQIADSLWALSTGGVTGTGLGLGSPEIVPAAHTDLILSALGEQLGWLGLAAVFVLYSVLVWRGLRIALAAPGVYSFFLVAGLTLITALQILLIAGGLLGLIPLSGVVSPFLSYGRTSMAANFVLFGIILAVSARSRAVKSAAPSQAAHFGAPIRIVGAVLAAAVVIVLARAAWVQSYRADQVLTKGALVLQADGVRRYQYNPRILQIARELPKGDIFDRNGVPIATSDWPSLEQHRSEYEKLGIHLDQAVSKNDRRHYPLGAPFFYLVGDVRSDFKPGATNTAFEERASRIRLQGYDDVLEVEQAHDVNGQPFARLKHDYRALIPLLRHKWEPDNPQVKEILNRPKDVHMSIDAALQLRAAAILQDHLRKLHKDKGSVVIVDPANGDLLAAVSYPWPLNTSPDAPGSENYLDRARFGLFPPGSSFKIVTAVAALRQDPSNAAARFDCIALPDGRVGNYVAKRAIRDDVSDRSPHGSVDMQKGIAVSCNAYFAQLGASKVGAQALFDAAAEFGISVAVPNTAAKLRQFLPQASYGQGQVVASPFQMARVAATIANSGAAPQGRWIVDETNPRVRPPRVVLDASLTNQIAGYMRSVVTSGTGRSLAGSPVPIAGKTGTAELADAPSHAWFIGFAPYGPLSPDHRRIAFSVLVENGQYGGTAAAPIAGELVAAARQLGII